jgi:hypothetical protein
VGIWLLTMLWYRGGAILSLAGNFTHSCPITTQTS